MVDSVCSSHAVMLSVLWLFLKMKARLWIIRWHRSWHPELPSFGHINERLSANISLNLFLASLRKGSRSTFYWWGGSWLRHFLWPQWLPKGLPASDWNTKQGCPVIMQGWIFHGHWVAKLLFFSIYQRGFDCKWNPVVWYEFLRHCASPHDRCSSCQR